MSQSNENKQQKNFIESIIEEDLHSGKHQTIITRFPPEPNGYLHIGHAKAICLNFGLAQKYNGICNLRLDDTNPEKEEKEYVESIIRDVQWLGFNWQDRLYYASSYFQKMYNYAEELIKKGLAFVCDLNPEQIRQYRGTLTKPGKNSPYRDRSPEENLDLFRRMKAGEFEEGSRVLRAKIDMASPNINMRDPVIYRIQKQSHQKTGDTWCIYPMYDFAHPLEDAEEKVTHSICTLEFEDHRPLYDWVIQHCSVPAIPRQIEFARLNLTYTVLSKRKLIELVRKNIVKGWDDPRMPTITGLKRRGYTPESIQKFAEIIGVSKSNSLVDIDMLNFCLREHLNQVAPRVMVVLDPLKVIITNYPQDQVQDLEIDNNPEDLSMGKRSIPFTREIYIERSDFREEPHKKWYRFAPGNEVRLMKAYYVTCNKVIKDQAGKVIELHCTYDPETKGGWSKDGRKVKGTSHWVSAKYAVDIQVNLYDHLFKTPEPNKTKPNQTYLDNINPESLKIITAKAEPSLLQTQAGKHYQFLRVGYFVTDPDSKPQKPIFNRTTTLRDTWSKLEQKLNN